MELVFLSKEDLSVLDFGYVDSDFQIIIDSVIPQKSTFQVNKVKIDVEIGDIVILKNSVINYIGIICSIEEDEEKGQCKIQTNDFISILDIKVKLNSYSGNISLYLYDLIYNAYISNNDPYQKISYLQISRDYQVISGSLNYEDDTIDSISNVVNTLNKAYSIGVKYNLIFDNGTISGIELHITSVTKGMILKSNFSGVSNLVISTSGDQSINKITFIPSDENVSYKSRVSYYLLTDGTITTNASDSKRIKNVSSSVKIYKDSDYATLLTTAQSEMLISSLEHSIQFNLLMNNQVVDPFVDLNVGDFIEFITPDKTYQTLVTQFSFKGNLYQASVTLGEYRINLTDKIKLLTKK